jgi:hypothetical protein
MQTVALRAWKPGFKATNDFLTKRHSMARASGIVAP